MALREESPVFIIAAGGQKAYCKFSREDDAMRFKRLLHTEGVASAGVEYTVTEREPVVSIAKREFDLVEGMNIIIRSPLTPTENTLAHASLGPKEPLAAVAPRMPSRSGGGRVLGD